MAIPIALQLYSVREDAARDLSGVLAAVKNMGYDGVEFAGFYNHDAQTIRQMLQDTGLQICGAHIALDTLRGDALPETVEFHQTLGNQFLIVPGLGKSYSNSTESWKNTAQIFNQIAADLAPHGMKTGYHNHTIEFKPLALGDPLPWDVFFGSTTADVIMQFDTGNAKEGGADALPYLERYPGRALSVHLKEHSETNKNALIGEGDVPFGKIFEVCESTGGTEWYVVEQESYASSPLECAAKCLENLRAMGK